MQGTKGRGFNPARRRGQRVCYEPCAVEMTSVDHVAEAVNHLKVRSCLSDGEVVCWDERGPATFQLLRHRRNEPQAFFYAFDLLAAHTIEARLSRWLLRCHDLLGSDEITLTQEFLGDMLGVRRISVSLVAYSLQQAGLIRYRRGRIRVIDREGLQETACECYETVKAQAKRLLGYPVPRESLQV